MNPIKIKVNRNQSPEEMLKDTGYTLYVTDEVVKAMPKGDGSEVTVEFFKLDKYISDEDLEKEYTSRDLVPADPYSMLAVSQKTLDEMKYVATHWKDENGKWCFAAFDQWDDDGCSVNVSRSDRADGWYDRWWFCGIKKQDIYEERLLPNIEKTNTCWNWSGVISKGYGLIKIHSKSTRVHRLMYEVFVGAIPEGMVIDHLCKNKQCVNPEHLEAVTSRENTLRGNSPIAQKARQTHCINGHELSGDNLLIKKDGHRRCKQCHEK